MVFHNGIVFPLEAYPVTQSHSRGQKQQTPENDHYLTSKQKGNFSLKRGTIEARKMAQNLGLIPIVHMKDSS